MRNLSKLLLMDVLMLINVLMLELMLLKLMLLLTIRMLLSLWLSVWMNDNTLMRLVILLLMDVSMRLVRCNRVLMHVMSVLIRIIEWRL